VSAKSGRNLKYTISDATTARPRAIARCVLPTPGAPIDQDIVGRREKAAGGQLADPPHGIEPLRDVPETQARELLDHARMNDDAHRAPRADHFIRVDRRAPSPASGGVAAWGSFPRSRGSPEPRNALDAAERAASESDAAARERGKVPHADPLTAATALAASRSRRR
jgi:hypothetical protein